MGTNEILYFVRTKRSLFVGFNDAFPRPKRLAMTSSSTAVTIQGRSAEIA